jgi:hypothetical protein
VQGIPWTHFYKDSPTYEIIVNNAMGLNALWYTSWSDHGPNLNHPVPDEVQAIHGLCTVSSVWIPQHFEVKKQLPLHEQLPSVCLVVLIHLMGGTTAML